ncbi:XRE family transcriptional regulator, partial [Actinomadura sp. DSM 109109]|nr:XRE family transcriptional regulator [Actinomadura lepetitiana]
METGKKVATPAFVSAAAAALGVDPSELYGQPYRVYGHDYAVHSVIPELRRTLAYMEVGPELEGPPRALDVLAAEIATAHRLIHKAQLTKLAGRLPAVIEELTFWAHETGNPRAWLLLSRGFGHAVSLTRRLGYTGDAMALLERGAEAARRSGDPNLPHLVMLARALLMMSMDQYRPALTLLDRAAASVRPDRPDADEVAGAIELRSAIVAARAARGGDGGQ